MADLDIGHLASHRDEIVSQRSVGELTALIVEAFLEKCRAKTLHDAAAHLLVDKQRIDDTAAILDHPML